MQIHSRFLLANGLVSLDVVLRHWNSNTLSLPVHRPVPSFIQPASQLHTVVAHVACAGQLPSVLAQFVFTPSACTVTKHSKLYQFIIYTLFQEWSQLILGKLILYFLFV